MQRVGSILKRFVTDYGLEAGLPLNKIKNQWAHIAGETLAYHTYPDIIKDRTIFIVVDTPQWMHHVSFYKLEILEKLKPYKINKVRFKLGKVNRYPVKQREGHTVYKVTDNESQFIENIIKDIKDVELRDKFRMLFLKGFGYKRKT
jgi:hypothetical protein